MKNKKGFTLIELLAVIVILAIIALIAVPIVLNMIENARKSAAKSSTYGYIQAIDDNNELYEMNDDYDLTIEEIKGTNIPVSSINLKIKGKKPTSGTVTIDAKGRVSNATLCINNYTVTYNGTEATVGNKGCGGGSTPAASPVSFATDSWDMIAANTSSDKYKVGDTKCIKLNGFTTTNNNGCSNGEFKVRIANKTTCTSETSQTACGFVVEFVDVITTHNMNSSNTNVGGYPASAMYQEYFANNATNSLYSKLPSDLQNVIINTTVVSGHGPKSGETNFTSTDKLYLLSTKEIGVNVDYDTVKTETRILDYYNTNNNDASRVKQYNGSNNHLWLRSSATGTDDAGNFCFVISNGSCYNTLANYAYGVSPAFRVGVDS